VASSGTTSCAGVAEEEPRDYGGPLLVLAGELPCRWLEGDSTVVPFTVPWLTAGCRGCCR